MPTTDNIDLTTAWVENTTSTVWPTDTTDDNLEGGGSGSSSSGSSSSTHKPVGMTVQPNGQSNGQPNGNNSQSQGCDDDKSPLCVTIQASDCYTNTTRDECCETCDDFKLSDHIAGCQFGDRTPCPPDKPWRCYETTFRYNCCYTCDNYFTGVQGCEFGDRVDNCQANKCYSYSNERLDECCDTCSHQTSQSVSITTSSSQEVRSSESSDSPAWLGPVAGCVGGVLLILLLIFVFLWWRRRKREPQNLSPIDEKMYNDYKLSKRAPMALPRDTDSSNHKSLTRQDSAEYAYINPDEVANTPEEDNKRRSGNDPLPAPPSGPTEYLELGNADKYGYLEALGTIVKNGSSPPTTNGNQTPTQYSSLVSDGKDTSSQYRSLSTNESDGSIRYVNTQQTSPHRLNTYQKFPGDTSHMTPANDTNQSSHVRM